MSFTVRIEQSVLRKALQDVDRMQEQIQQDVKKALATTGINIRKKAIENIGSYGSRPKKMRNGETKVTAWLVDTATMKNSIAISFKNDFSDLPKLTESEDATVGTAGRALSKSTGSVAKAATGGTVTGVGTKVHYAKFQEFGTRKIKARPFLHPAAESEKASHHARLKKAVRKK